MVGAVVQHRPAGGISVKRSPLKPKGSPAVRTTSSRGAGPNTVVRDPANSACTYSMGG